MANKNLFRSQGQGQGKNVTAPDTVNMAGGKAYRMSERHALAQIACTNCFNGTFYASAQDNLKIAKDAALALTDDPQFVAKTAIYARDKAYMKDMPAFLAVVLADIDPVLFHKVFDRVINNGKMLRNFCQIARSGQATGRVFNLSAGACRRAIQRWFDNRNDFQIFHAIVGNDPKLSDILRMARPKPNTAEKNALFGYILNKEVEFESLPQIVQDYERYKATKEGEVPKVDFRLLDSLDLGAAEWTEIARNGKWMFTRMNLNTFARHGVFKDEGMARLIADRLKNKEEIRAANQFPYQIQSAWKATTGNNDVPHEVREALQDAMEIAIDNVPTIDGQIYICVDTSGSMKSPITGGDSWSMRRTTDWQTKVQCVEVAGLIASSIVRKNQSAEVWTFSHDAVKVNLNPRDTVLTNTEKLAKAGGGTNVSAPLRKLNENRAKGRAVIYVSDYESWLDNPRYYGTGLQDEWTKFQERNPDAKLVCIDLTPRNNSQAEERPNILSVGGFSDSVFDIMANFIEHGSESDHWVSEIEATPLD